MHQVVWRECAGRVLYSVYMAALRLDQLRLGGDTLLNMEETDQDMPADGRQTERRGDKMDSYTWETN